MKVGLAIISPTKKIEIGLKVGKKVFGFLKRGRR
jgi:hypothetical protein